MSSSVYLGVESASPYLALALWSREGVLERFCEEVGRDHAARIGVELERLLARAEVRRADLVGVGVGTGPGSYTGLRVGVAVAKGIAQGLGIGLYGETSLAAMAAANLTSATPRGIVALDARRDNVYAGVFELLKGELRHGEIEKVPREHFRSSLP